jgi:hypothetical protein
MAMAMGEEEVVVVVAGRAAAKRTKRKYRQAVQFDRQKIVFSLVRCC